MEYKTADGALAEAIDFLITLPLHPLFIAICMGVGDADEDGIIKPKYGAVIWIYGLLAWIGVVALTWSLL